ncbi:MAG: hypothetical protein ACE5J9_09940 [Methanosarcinales archaeon]
MSDVSLDFFKKYHRAVCLSLGDEIKKVNAKIGSIFANDFLDSLDTELEYVEDFANSFERYLTDLNFADTVKVTCTQNDYNIDITGCCICHGNELLRQEKKQTACPILQTANYAMLKSMGKNVKTKGVKKTGVVGECTLQYELMS